MLWQHVFFSSDFTSSASWPWTRGKVQALLILFRNPSKQLIWSIFHQQKHWKDPVKKSVVYPIYLYDDTLEFWAQVI